jgi:hypothetical protein
MQQHQLWRGARCSVVYNRYSFRISLEKFGVMPESDGLSLGILSPARPGTCGGLAGRGDWLASARWIHAGIAVNKLGESLLPLHLGCGAAAVSYPSCSWRRGGEDAEIVCRQIQWLAGVSSHWCIVERMSSRLSGELLGGRRWSFSLRQIP